MMNKKHKNPAIFSQIYLKKQEKTQNNNHTWADVRLIPHKYRQQCQEQHPTKAPKNLWAQLPTNIVNPRPHKFYEPKAP